MKVSTFFSLCFLVVNVAVAQPPEGKAQPGDKYGAGTDGKGALPASELARLVNEKDTADVKVSAQVLEVCSKKGCWMTLKVNDSTEAFVKMKDYGFFVPVALAGKKIVLEGKAFVKTTTVAELKHYAEDARKPQKEIDAITRDKKEIRLIAKGVLVVD